MPKQTTPDKAPYADSPFVPGDQKTFQKGVAAYDAHHYADAFNIFWDLSQNYDLAAMRNIALMERDGVGTAKDPLAAEKMMEAAAQRGLPTAQADLGAMLMDGAAGPPDKKAALPWLERAATSGHPVAQYRMAELYEEGEVLPRDLPIAKRLYMEAAKYNVPGAAAKVRNLASVQAAPVQQANTPPDQTLTHP